MTNGGHWEAVRYQGIPITVQPRALAHQMLIVLPITVTFKSKSTNFQTSGSQNHRLAHSTHFERVLARLRCSG